MSESITFNEDCLEVMRRYPDGFFDLAVVDPPYGIGEDGGKNRSGYVKQKNGSKLYVSDGNYRKMNWDSRPPDAEVFAEMKRISKNQIIFGVNHFDYAFPGGRIVWDKCNDGSDQSDAEIAFCSFNKRTDIFRYMWRGMMQGKSISEGTTQQGNKQRNEKRIHPTQKPVALYHWIFQKYLQEGQTIFDPYLGSGSSRIAAYDLGFDFVGVEIGKTYFDLQEERFREHTAQGNLFLME